MSDDVEPQRSEPQESMSRHMTAMAQGASMGPRGQQQEWFYHAEGSNRFHVYFGSVVVGGVIVGTERQAKAICDANNAAIAIERERHKTAYLSFRQRLNAFEQQLAAERQLKEDWRQGRLACEKQLDATVKALAAERQRPHVAEDIAANYYARLLSAQAAIEKLAELIIELDGGKLSFDHAKVLHGIRNDVDLSALHQHAAKLLANAAYIKCAKCSKPALRYSSTIDGLRCQACGVAYLNCEQVDKREASLAAEVREKERKYWQNIAAAHDCSDLTDAFVQLTKVREVRKPLVESLELIKRRCPGYPRKVAAEALAEVKERKC